VQPQRAAAAACGQAQHLHPGGVEDARAGVVDAGQHGRLHAAFGQQHAARMRPLWPRTCGQALRHLGAQRRRQQGAHGLA